ncbi:putative RNA-directed DNA polymerase from transposon BS [Trichonephila clavipes]|nr:putative RNA-directed DNA polymerase from transposon BS [Trichonephila clavipes]
MPSEKFAFRKGHSTVDQILYFTQCVRDSQNHKPMRQNMAAFLDVSNAFDRSTVSLFTTNRHLYNYSPEIFLSSERLNYSKYPTYLGFTLDSEVNCGKHIEKIADKARKRISILKYLSGRDWGSDASTLRITYTTLVCPVLEYGYQIFLVASPTNLKETGEGATQCCEDYHGP